MAYRFTIWFPVQAQGKPVFTKVHQAHLIKLFYDCLGGFSQSSQEGFPPWAGSWLPPETQVPVVDHHILLIVYTLQGSDALACMRQLKWAIQQDEAAAQQVVLVERVPVTLIEAEELS